MDPAVSMVELPATPKGVDGSLIPALLDVLSVTLAGALFRLGPLLTSANPLHDGGLFVVMIRDIRAAGMTIPATTTYNGGDVPFSYPPLALWVAALLPADPLTIVRFAGPLVAFLTVPMVYLLARELLPGRPYAYVAALIYALSPRGWDWLVTGGGLTRAPGLLLVVVGIWMLLRLYRTGKSRYVVGAAVFGGLAVVTHPEAAVCAAVAYSLLALLRVRDRAALLSTIWVVVGGFLVTLPWLLLLASRGQLSGLTQAGSQGVDPLISFAMILKLDLTDELFVQAVLGLGLLGALVLARSRSWFIVLWLLAEVVIAARGAPTYAAIPMALAGSYGLYDAIGRGVLRIPRPDVFRSNAVRGVLLMVLLWSAVDDFDLLAGSYAPFDGVTANGFSDMAWIKSQTPADARFAVIAGTPWPNDVYGEWLPALADRVSVATMQGREWLSRSAWDDALDSYAQLQLCVHSDATCLATWTKAHSELETDYVYVVDTVVSHPLVLSVELSPEFQVVHKSKDGVVARLIAGP